MAHHRTIVKNCFGQFWERKAKVSKAIDSQLENYYF